jgi:hypothetical protein
MDLDFHCHRPFRCLVDHVGKAIQHKRGDSPSGPAPKHVLVVAREPLAHAVVFRNKTRVVIQVRATFIAIYFARHVDLDAVAGTLDD